MSERNSSAIQLDGSHELNPHTTTAGVVLWDNKVESGKQNISTTEDVEKVTALQRQWLGRIITKTRKFVDIAIIATVIVAVWGLLSLPLIFIAIEESSFVQSNDSTCNPQCYTGHVCYDTLSSRQQCIPGMKNSTDVLIKSDPLLGFSQESLESFLVDNFSSQPHSECDEIIVALICLLIFTPCGKDGQLHALSMEECTAVRDTQCAENWTKIETLFSDKASLPLCETLLPTSESSLCSGADRNEVFNKTGDPLGSVIAALPSDVINMNTNLSSSSPNFTCSANFYFDGYCKPICGQWKPFPDAVDTASKVITITGAVIGIIMGVMITALSVLKYKSMLKFPSILILYQTADASIFFLVTLIGYIDTESLLCPSRDFTQSILSSTAYCTCFGIGVFYFTVHALILWASHVAIVLWHISFPLQAKYAQTSRHYRLLHIIVLTLATVLPAAYTALTLGMGDHRPFYYPYTCISASTEAIIYIDTLVCLFGSIGVSCLALLLWVLAKRRWKCCLMASRNCNEQIHLGNSLIPTTTLFKILLSFTCNSAVLFIGTFFQGSVLRVQSQYKHELKEYFTCESMPGIKECSRSFEGLINPLFSSISTFLVGTAYTSVNLLYVVNLEKLCRGVKQCLHGRNGLHSTSTLQNGVSIKTNL